MEPTLEHPTSTQELFRRESINAASTSGLAPAKIARSWGVVVIATLSLPLLAGLAVLLTSYSYERVAYAHGVVEKADSAPCGDTRRPGLVGVLAVDELRLRDLQEGTLVAVRVPAISRTDMRGTVLCVSEALGKVRPSISEARFEVVVSLGNFAIAEHEQPLRSGMSLEAITHKSTVKLLRLFTKDGNDDR